MSENKIHDTSRTPAPSSIAHPPKKRRVTISGAPALNTDVRVAPDQTNSTPISPVVIGLNIQRDNPSEVEQIRSMITVKQQQQALIEQRRGSNAGPMSPTVASGPSGEGQSKGPAAGSRPIRRSPNSGIGNRRHTVVSQPSVHKQPSPNPTAPPSTSTSTSIPSHSLPPPPISFARRRANQIGNAKRKPADIMISPRDAHTPDQFAPSIQSAPPIPHAGHQGSGIPGRFPMALPRLPSVMGVGDTVRRTVGGNVPPTPRSLQRVPATQSVSHPIPGIAGRSPPTASVAIASTLVPPTPSALHNPTFMGEKSAFLAPYEALYDTLNDSRQLKAWLSEQMQRSKVLIQTLTQQQDKLQDVVDSLVEKKVSGMRAEISGLHRRVDELEDALRVATSSRRPSLEGPNSSSKSKGKQPVRNGIPSGSTITEGYTFPPVLAIDRERLRSSESEHRVSPAGWAGADKEPLDSDNGSPAPFEPRRLSLSSSRLEPPRAQSMENTARPFAMPSPPIPMRDGPSILPPGSKLSRGGRPPGSNRQQSSPRLGGTQDAPVTSSPKRDESRRNSVVEFDTEARES